MQKTDSYQTQPSKASRLTLNFLSLRSSVSKASTLPARQKDTSETRVHGYWYSGATHVPASVDQWPKALSGIQLFHPARMQAAGISKLNTPASSAALCNTGSSHSNYRIWWGPLQTLFNINSGCSSGVQLHSVKCISTLISICKKKKTHKKKRKLFN